MERYVAVDNVCAWPNLTLMPDGAIVATIFNQPTHGEFEGDVECWASDDEGRTWSLRGMPASHEPGTNRMNVAAGLARDGSLVVLASGWTNRAPAGTHGGFAGAKTLAPWVCRSSDGGRTWERCGCVPPPPEGAKSVIPFGDIVPLGDGCLGVCIYTWSPPEDHRSLFYASADDGRTWEVRGALGSGKLNETAPVALPDGALLAAARTLGDQHLELYTSSIHGATWEHRMPLTLGMQHPGHLLLLRDDRLLLSYGIRNPGLYGVGVRLSEDQGRTWSPPRVLVNLTDPGFHPSLAPGQEGGPWYHKAQDVGYPSSVEMADGTLVTAYYCNGVSANQRYHMGVVRWRPGE